MQSKKDFGWDAEWFAATLRLIIDRLGVKQARVAEWAGVRQSQVSRWVGGTSRPGFENLRKMQRALLAVKPEDDELRRLVDELGAAAGYSIPLQGVADLGEKDVDSDQDVKRIRELGLDPIAERMLIELRISQIRQLNELVSRFRSGHLDAQ